MRLCIDQSMGMRQANPNTICTLASWSKLVFVMANIEESSCILMSNVQLVHDFHDTWDKHGDPLCQIIILKIFKPLVCIILTNFMNLRWHLDKCEK